MADTPRGLALLLIAGACALPLALHHSGPKAEAGDGIAAPPPEGAALIAVDYKDNLSEADAETLEQSLNIDLDWSTPSSQDEALRSGTVAHAAETLAKLQQNPLIEAAEVVVSMKISGFPDDPLYPKQWNFPLIGAPVGWQVGGGRGVIVAVLDTGVSPLPDLPANRIMEGKSFVPGIPTAADDHGHGTHVAGTIAQATHNGIGVAGIAPNAIILPMKVLGADGSGRSDWIAAAVDEAVDQGAKVINMSLGGGHSDVLVKAVQKARAAGVVVVAAAGNDGREGLGSPADAEAAIAVTAVGPDDQLAPYSSWGKGVEIAAPGGNKNMPEGGITQATIDNQGGQQFAEWQGTSMATPHVAGAAAILWGAGAESADEVEQYLKEGAVKRDDPLHFGAGRLDIAGAVQALLLARRGTLFASGAMVSLALCWLARLNGLGRWLTVGLGGIIAGGLFFLPLLPLPASTMTSLLSAPLLSWPGPFWSGFPLWQSCLLPLFLAPLLGASRRLGPLGMALAAGVGSYLIYGAATNNTGLWWMPFEYDRLWLLANGGISLLMGLAVAGVQKLRRSG